KRAVAVPEVSPGCPRGVDARGLVPVRVVLVADSLALFEDAAGAVSPISSGARSHDVPGRVERPLDDRAGATLGDEPPARVVREEPRPRRRVDDGRDLSVATPLIGGRRDLPNVARRGAEGRRGRPLEHATRTAPPRDVAIPLDVDAAGQPS